MAYGPFSINYRPILGYSGPFVCGKELKLGESLVWGLIRLIPL